MFDLHFHSDASDGLATLETVRAKVAASPLTLLALADHDTIVASVQLARIEPRAWIAAELTSYLGEHRVDVLGLHLAPDYPELNDYLTQRSAERRARFLLFGEVLRGDGWVFEPSEETLARPQLTSPHVAAELRRQPANAVRLTNLGIALDWTVDRDIESADDPIYALVLDHFNELIREQTEVAVVETTEMVKLIHRAGGLAVVAHPWLEPYSLGQTPFSQAREMLDSLVAVGLDGLELWHHTQTEPAVRTELTRYLARHELLTTAGSDDHSSDLHRLGTALPPEVNGQVLYEQICQAALCRAAEAG